MKKFFLWAFIITTALIGSSSINAMFEYDIYLENHYGSTIKYKTSAPNGNSAEISVENMQRSLVGEGNFIEELSIRTTGQGSRYFSYFTDLTDKINTIKNESLKLTNQDKDAIILIKPSRSYQSWNIEVTWEKSKQEIEAMSPVEILISKILSGKFGEEYAKKVSALSTYNYTKAVDNGQPDLNRALTNIIEVFLDKKPLKSIHKPLENNPLNSEREKELKENIDGLYKILLTYKNRF
jgi:hypothetical protein